MGADDFPSHRTGVNSVKSTVQRRLSSSYGAPRANTASFSGPVRAYQAPTYGPSHRGYDRAPQPYHFDYSVNDPYTGTVFSQNEENDGKTTRGYYSVNLPDGRIQHVKYTADDYNGYNADVTYTGKAQYPEEKSGYGRAGASYKPSSGYQKTYSSYQSYDDDDDYKYRRV